MMHRDTHRGNDECSDVLAMREIEVDDGDVRPGRLDRSAGEVSLETPPTRLRPAAGAHVARPRRLIQSDERPNAAQRRQRDVG